MTLNATLKWDDSSTKVAEERGKALKIAYADTSAKADLMLMLFLKCRRAVFSTIKGVLNNGIRAQQFRRVEHTLIFV